MATSKKLLGEYLLGTAVSVAVWFVVNPRPETNPVIISTLPVQDTNDFFNVRDSTARTTSTRTAPGALSLQSDTLVYATFFNGSARVFDATNPFHSHEVACYIPQIPEGAEANRINDVRVDENGIMSVVDRLQGGMYILELTL